MHNKLCRKTEGDTTAAQNLALVMKIMRSLAVLDRQLGSYAHLGSFSVLGKVFFL